MKVLVTGGSGFLGSHLVKYYLDKGDTVYSLARNEYRQWKLKQRFPAVNIIIGDVVNFNPFEPVVDLVIHCAALKHVSFCDQFRDEAFRTNYQGTGNMINWAMNSGVKDFLLISSDKAIEPSCYYGKTKQGAEELTNRAGFRIARFGNFFGSTGTVVEIWFKKLLQGEKKIQLHHRDMRRHFVQVDDACEKIDYFLSTDSRMFIYGGMIGRMDDLARAIFGDDVEIEITEMLQGEKLVEKMDIDLREEDFGKYTVDDLRLMFLEWAKEKRGILVSDERRDGER